MGGAYSQSDITDCIAKLTKMSEDLSTFPTYISHIRFPLFKNLSTDLRIDFEFPVTALVGANGSGKSSVLHALYGAPIRKSTGDFWFSTHVDPIVEGKGSPNRYIYGHYNSAAKRFVETRKARVRKVKDEVENPNYWEPTKIAPGDGMEDIPDEFKGKKIAGLSKDRWYPVKRDVLYMNFRSELSAFDKFFYFGVDPELKRLQKKRDLILRDAKILREVIDQKNLSVTRYNKPVATENRELSDEELDWVRYILGREYKSARIIRHALFRGRDGLSVQFEVGQNKYSEAFAGSGEVAVTSAVSQILNLAEGTLILLDEPEVSLHPGAQERLLHFLLYESKRKKHQVVFSTHAPSMIGPLPDKAIKVFIPDAAGRFSVLPQAHPYAAFRRLGFKEGGSIRVIVEDRLAKYVVEQAARLLSDEERELLNIEFYAGGADAILKNRIPMLLSDKSTFFLLDGDKRKVDSFVNSQDIAPAKNSMLLKIIAEQVGLEPLIIVDGNGQANAAQRAVLCRQYLDFIQRYLHYLPKSCPEEIVIDAVPELKNMGPISSSQDAKSRLAKATLAFLNENSSDAIDRFAQFKLASVRDGNAHLKEIASLLQSFIAKVKPANK